MQLAHRRRRSGPFRGQPGDRSFGAVLVEAVFVTPVFFILVLGLMEVGLAMNDNLALAHSTRAGTRVASASGNDLYADYGIVRAVRREISALPNSQIKAIVVYEASAFGAAPTPQCQGGADVAGVCNAYTVADFAQPKAKWGCVTSGLDTAWCPKDRDISQTGGTDHVGVWIKIEHPWLTRMFGNTVTLTDRSVIRLEPRIKT